MAEIPVAVYGRDCSYFIFLALIAELPFYIASQPGDIPGTFIIALFSAGLVSSLVYLFCDQFPVFFNNSKIMAYIKIAAMSLFILFDHMLMFNGRLTGPYLVTAFYPDLVIALIYHLQFYRKSCRREQLVAVAV